MAKKMVLVDPRILAATKYDQPPTTDALLNLDEDMRHVLSQSDLSPERKVDMYNQILQKHRHFYQQHRSLPTLTDPGPFTPPQQDSDNQPPPVKVDSIEEDVLKSTPSTFQRKARLLMELVKRNPQLSWNQRGELTVKDQPIEGSHMIDLVNDVLRHRRSRAPPTGWEQFAEALRDSNVPQDLIGHPERWEYIRRGTQRVYKTDSDGEHSSHRWQSWRS